MTDWLTSRLTPTQLLVPGPSDPDPEPDPKPNPNPEPLNICHK